MADASQVDEENASTVKPLVAARDKSEFKEAAILLAMWSILVANEGVIRFIEQGQPGAPRLFASTGPNRFVGAFLGGLFEVIFGIFGLCVGLSAGVLGFYNRTLALALVATQNLLGWYVFIDFVFVLPSYAISKGIPVPPELSVGEGKLVGVMGILTSVAFCLALQGGQFVFMTRMIAFSTEGDFLKQRSGSRMRAVFWNMNYALAGLWVLIQASVIISAGYSSLSPFFRAPPNAGRIPVYLLITGLIMLVWPLLGVMITVTGRKEVVRKYAALSFFVFLWVYVHYTIGQLGFMTKTAPNPSIPAAGASMHNGLVMMVCFLGPYFMLKYADEQSA